MLLTLSSRSREDLRGASFCLWPTGFEIPATSPATALFKVRTRVVNDEERKSIPKNQSSDSRKALASCSIRKGLFNNTRFAPINPLPMAV